MLGPGSDLRERNNAMTIRCCYQTTHPDAHLAMMQRPLTGSHVTYLRETSSATGLLVDTHIKFRMTKGYFFLVCVSWRVPPPKKKKKLGPHAMTESNRIRNLALSRPKSRRLEISASKPKCPTFSSPLCRTSIRKAGWEVASPGKARHLRGRRRQPSPRQPVALTERRHPRYT